MCPNKHSFVSGGEDEMQCKIKYKISEKHSAELKFYYLMYKTGISTCFIG